MFNTWLSEAVRPEPSPVSWVEQPWLLLLGIWQNLQFAQHKVPFNWQSYYNFIFDQIINLERRKSFIYLKHKVRVLLIKNNVTVIYQANPGPLFTSGK